MRKLPIYRNFLLTIGACLVVLDCLPMLDSLGSDPVELESLQRRCSRYLSELLSHGDCHCLHWIYSEKPPELIVKGDAGGLSVGPFRITEGEDDPMETNDAEDSTSYCFEAPTVSRNALRVARALQVGSKPVLLEGAPGVGKSAAVQAIAKVSGKELVRINLSEQTDVADLFGSDLPEGGASVGR